MVSSSNHTHPLSSKKKKTTLNNAITLSCVNWLPNIWSFCLCANLNQDFFCSLDLLIFSFGLFCRRMVKVFLYSFEIQTFPYSLILCISTFTLYAISPLILCYNKCHRYPRDNDWIFYLTYSIRIALSHYLTQS